MFYTACTGSTMPCRSLVVNQCGLDLRDLIYTQNTPPLESMPSVYMHITQQGTSTAVPTCIHDLCIDRPPFSPVQLESMTKERMCLSCSSEAVPYDSLVDMLFFQLPLGAENNLAVPLNPALNSSSSSQRRVVQ
jgi:hypothetical protein